MVMYEASLQQQVMLITPDGNIYPVSVNDKVLDKLNNVKPYVAIMVKRKSGMFKTYLEMPGTSIYESLLAYDVAQVIPRGVLRYLSIKYAGEFNDIVTLGSTDSANKISLSKTRILPFLKGVCEDTISVLLKDNPCNVSSINYDDPRLIEWKRLCFLCNDKNWGSPDKVKVIRELSKSYVSSDEGKFYNTVFGTTIQQLVETLDLLGGSQGIPLVN